MCVRVCLCACVHARIVCVFVRECRSRSCEFEITDGIYAYIYIYIHRLTYMYMHNVHYMYMYAFTYNCKV